MAPGSGNGRCRIVLTGGPGGGKTTAADLFSREIGEQVVVVPEAASMLFSAGFPRVEEPAAVRAVQRAIYHLQRNLEDVQAARFPGRILLCDRGTVDGAAYWPEGDGRFFDAMQTTIEQELARYDAVIFFQTSAVSGHTSGSNNPHRIEDVGEACRLDDALRQAWSQHHRFVLVPHNPSFFKKITFGLATIESIVEQLRHERRVSPSP
jgi:predicted ATPase